ncbi:MAG TPA: ParB/RepB/Spo0J family partition protein [Nocardioidaceae bacterium]|nr:ParB/RepB/Spo0J family partition protein [Nocardioidaceae bacterium]
MSAEAQPLAGLAAIPIGQIRRSPNNPREHYDDIDELAASIRESGLIQPIVVQQVPGYPGFQIVAGHRRHAAVVQLGWGKVPCLIRRDMLPDEELLAMLVENGQRSSLDPIEEARALNRLRSFGMTDAEVARKVGRSLTLVKARLMLLQLPVREQEAVRDGHYTLTHAEGLVRAEREAARRRDNPVSRPVGRPKGAKTKPHFGDTHPLAETVRVACRCRTRPKVGGVGCGQCWEAAIRADAASQVVAS